MTYHPETPEEAEYIRLYDPSKYNNPMVTVDTIITRGLGPYREVVLVKRKGFPYKDYWALPGGFVDEGETVRDAAEREVMEEAGLSLKHMEFFGVADEPDRDPRGRAISMVFKARADGEPFAGDDAVEARWFLLIDAKMMTLAFDHNKILQGA